MKIVIGNIKQPDGKGDTIKYTTFLLKANIGEEENLDYYIQLSNFASPNAVDTIVAEEKRKNIELKTKGITSISSTDKILSTMPSKDSLFDKYVDPNSIVESPIDTIPIGYVESIQKYNQKSLAKKR